MMLWFVLTAMTWAAAMWLAVPFVRRSDLRQEQGASDIAVYHDQLQELDRDVTDGLIDEEQADAARIEIKRRILAVDDGARTTAMPGLSSQVRSFALIGSTGILVLGSVMLYAVIGSPDLALTHPASSGGASPSAGFPRHLTALEGFLAADTTPDSSGERQAGLPTVEEMTQRLAARLASNPTDIQGWRTLGWSYLNIGRFSAAADAYAKAIELDPNNVELRGGLVEALVGSADGTVTTEAKSAIAETLRIDPKNARARYFDGLAHEQAGDKTAALAAWSDLLKEHVADESWASELRTRVSALRRDIGLDQSAAVDEPEPASQASPEPPRTSGKGPSPKDVQAADALLPADRAAMIRGMVENLASRLEQSPRDADGWIKLIRSRVVLGEGGLAREALAHGLAAFADDTTERGRIAAAAQELGVGQ
jgi:cytochrome c-type biogenesis protein CcmH